MDQQHPAGVGHELGIDYRNLTVYGRCSCGGWAADRVVESDGVVAAFERVAADHRAHSRPDAARA